MVNASAAAATGANVVKRHFSARLGGGSDAPKTGYIGFSYNLGSYLPVTRATGSEISRIGIQGSSPNAIQWRGMVTFTLPSALRNADRVVSAEYRPRVLDCFGNPFAAHPPLEIIWVDLGNGGITWNPTRNNWERDIFGGSSNSTLSIDVTTALDNAVDGNDSEFTLYVKFGFSGNTSDLNGSNYCNFDLDETLEVEYID